MSSLFEQECQGLADALRGAVVTATERGELPPVEIPEYVVEVPRESEHGDFATNLCFLLARPMRMTPLKIAEAVCNRLDLTGLPVARVEIAGPGFINFFLRPNWVLEILPQIEEYDNDYGRACLGCGKKIQVEFVSANPTGLLHMGNARGAALGDSIASILEFAGFEVEREFYINDAGNQIERFGESLEARYFQLLGHDVVFPEDGYHGEDLIETVNRFISRYGDRFLRTSKNERVDKLTAFALEEKVSTIKKALVEFGVKYDVWFSEKSLHESGFVRQTIERMQEKGLVYEKEHALWFKAREFGLEKDEVLVRGNGVPTYFAADIAYHVDKFRRGFNRVINIWGADHHGHVARLKAALIALGYDADNLDIIIMQLVRLYRGGEIVRMSKRSGQFVTLEELVDEVGADAARFFFVMRSADSHLDFDLDLAKAQSNENPVYYVQYAHARICSIIREWNNSGRNMPRAKEEKLSLLCEDAELALVRKLVEFPMEVSAAATDLSPHRITRCLHEMAGFLHSFYNAHRVIVGDAELARARLVLMNCTRIVLRNGLRLLGCRAPERM